MHTRPTHNEIGATGRRRPGAPVCAAIVLLACTLLWSQSAPLAVERHGDRLRLVAPQFHFLAGAPLERLHEGAAVTYILSATLQAPRGEAGRVRRTERVIVSYDLWEERFSVVQANAPRGSASHLTAEAAEAWCLDLLALPVPAPPAAKTFVVKLECSLPDEEVVPPSDASSGSTLGTLIDVFSRKTRAAPPRWEAMSGVLRLADLRDTARQ